MENKKFNETLLSEYMEQCFGYGNLDGDYWFVGMEEGGGNSFEEVNRRIRSWAERGKRELEDLFEYHKEIRIEKWFKETETAFEGESHTRQASRSTGEEARCAAPIAERHGKAE